MHLKSVKHSSYIKLVFAPFDLDFKGDKSE